MLFMCIFLCNFMRFWHMFLICCKQLCDNTHTFGQLLNFVFAFIFLKKSNLQSQHLLELNLIMSYNEKSHIMCQSVLYCKVKTLR